MGALALPILTRNVPTLLNVAFNGWLAGIEVEPLRAPMFWDSREQGLEAQALIPLRTLGEMLGPGCDEASAVLRAVERVGAVAEYRLRFRSAFGGRGTAEERARSEVRGNAGSVSAREPARTGAGEARASGGASPVTAERLAMALAAFERTLVTGGARVDRYLRGDTQAFEAREVAGLRVFERAGCQHCHGGPMFSDYKLHFIGAPDTSPSGDGSRALRTPTLRNLRRTAPYMHNGSLRTLREVLAFYEALSDRVSETLDGGDLQSQPPLDPLLRSLNLVADDFEALEAFLGTLESPTYDLSRPTRVPSGLAVPIPIRSIPPL